jgi:predicted Zn-dependent protease
MRHPFRLLPVFLLVSLVGCAVNPVTGKTELSLVSESQEISMGQEGAEDMKAMMGVYEDEDLQAYVTRLGMRIAENSERPHLPWSFTVVDDPIINAFALPGGPVFVSRGILAHMGSEGELVSVLGHEVGHITAKHSVSRMSNATLAQLGLGVGSIFAGEYGDELLGIGSAGLGVLFLKYGRDDETQSDELGFRYMQEIGYDPREMPKMFRILERVSTGSTIPEWQSTHPDPGNRVERAETALAAMDPATLDALRVGRDEFLDRIDGLVYGDDPRQGYESEGQFIHPGLAFRFDVPAGWTLRNSPSQVIVFPESQEGYLQLRGAGTQAPGPAAAEFFGQEAITGQPTTTEINGLPASVGDFRAQTGSGTVQGRAAFIGLDDGTYLLLGLTTADKWSVYEPRFRAAIASFARETRADRLSVEPMRVDVVTLSRAQSLAEFHTANPSPVDLTTLGLLNGIEDPDARLASGTRVKRVTGGVPAP